MISSVAGKNGNPLTPAYAASKHALEGLSESLRRELMLFGIDVIIVAPGPVRTPIWGKGQQDVDIAKYQNSPYLPALQKVSAYMQHLDSIGLPPEKIADVVFDALTLPKPKVRYQVAPDPMRHIMTAVLPKRMVDRIIAKRLGLMPPT
jgi:short-subunit dehydrogenase